MSSKSFLRKVFMKGMKKGGDGEGFAWLGLILLVGICFWANSEMNSLIRRDQLRLVPEKTATAEVQPMVSPLTGKPIEIVGVIPQGIYRGGPVAYVDFSIDPQGECVVVWYPDGRFANCADAPEGWQTMFPYKVPGGTDYAMISREWDKVFAPDNLR
jgi:hypothetical protein